MMRLQKFLSQAGIASRRKAEDLITSGAITINGAVITKLGTTIDETTDVVTFNGAVIKPSKHVYYALHKPVGYVSSTTSAQGPSVLELIKNSDKLFPVGRLDKDSSGLLLITNDGDFAQLITHAKNNCEKEYFVTLDQDLRPDDIKILTKGMRLGRERLSPARVVSAKNKSARIVLKQGINRQVRRMLGELGYTVIKLKRVRVGKLELGELKSGQYKTISPDQVL